MVDKKLSNNDPRVVHKNVNERGAARLVLWDIQETTLEAFDPANLLIQLLLFSQDRQA